MLVGLLLLLSVGRVAVEGRRGEILFRTGPSDAITEAAEWAEANTGIDATFMVSPASPTAEGAMFRPLSRRSLFVAPKDLAAILWKPSYLSVYIERMAALEMVADAETGRLHSPGDRRWQWKALSDERLSDVALRYGVDYVVFEAERETELPVVFRNETYKIARFPAASGQ